MSPLEQFGYQELRYLLVCYWPSVQSKKDILVMKGKIQNGVFRPVSANRVARNSEEFKVKDAVQVMSWRDMWQVHGDKCICGGLWGKKWALF